MSLCFEDVGRSLAWSIVTKIFAYTNHTVLPEALEKWSVSLMQSLVPRVAEIIFEINRRWMLEVKEVFHGDADMMSKLSIVEGEGEWQQVCVKQTVDAYSGRAC